MALVAIVGRPNVGKSTLFNRLTEERRAIVDDQPGVTRDRLFGEVEWTGRTFDLVDTGGLVPRSAERFDAAIREQVVLTLGEADVILFVVDTLTGTTEPDQEVAKMLRRAEQPVIVVANKADTEGRKNDAAEFWGLGFDQMFPLSSVNGTGTGDFLDAVVAALPDEPERDESDDAPRIAFIGRPNVGKSSLANRLLGQTRSIVTEIAGTTRDSVDARVAWPSGGEDEEPREVVLVDTAGLRKKAKVKENVEFYSTLRTQRALQACDVAVLLVDAEQGLEGQDARVLREAAALRKGLVIVVNKWDLIEDKETNTARDMERGIREKMGLLDYVPVVFASAETGQRAGRVLDIALRVFDERRKRVPTARLNEVVEKAVQRQSPPSYRNNYVRIKYASQIRTEPPVFAFFANHPQGVKESYRRYLENQLRAAFGFEGVPLTLSFKQK
ncbi:ribosome biogenesis GTPase Der [Rubrivirga sp. S365]|uniref:GTPase Der n=1 Tax=Rubrivirga litoralis TaxID=3075598 RepID=A0ABU3BPB1_9BACT|nr:MULTISPECIES: ribosome biogenesis GTPase Der [unclassified Rubrivirga]MDT0631103.1 ribosome biogenesis GTPase Der [Rubrivirga sp. F394]MDT7855384.1 ribosome biogenesis GTPase Der [Rubrivirga sp. S365]